MLSNQIRWTIFPKDNQALLYPRYVESLDPVFDVDIDTPDLIKHPLYALSSPWQIILEEGIVRNDLGSNLKSYSELIVQDI